MMRCASQVELVIDALEMAEDEALVIEGTMRRPVLRLTK